jgi:hypothetical protein
MPRRPVVPGERKSVADKRDYRQRGRPGLSEPPRSNKDFLRGVGQNSQNGSEQDQRVVAGSNPAAPTTPGSTHLGRTREATDDDGTHRRVSAAGKGSFVTSTRAWAGERTS